MSKPFSSLDLDPTLVEGIESLGFKAMTPVQENAIPVGLEGKDLIACAQTGTGKTAAYLIPVLQHIKEKNKHGLSCLIIVPTRELAGQIDQQVMGLGYFTGISSFAIYGGSDSDNFSAQKRALENHSEIIIATPGRLIMMMKLGRVNFDSITHFILDEADKMLEMGFVEDIAFIEKKLPLKKQTMMFSATMPPKIRHFAKRILVDPVEVSIAVSKLAGGIIEEFYLVEEGGKIPLLQRLLSKAGDIGRMLIFTGRKDSADQIRIKLKEGGIDSQTLHSGKEQSAREKTLQDFKNKELKILVATNVMSRGIDIEGISHILNFDVPKDAEDYIHRAGRTARADKTGKAITFVNREDKRNLYGIEKLTEKKPNVLPLPEGLSKFEISNSPQNHNSGDHKNPKRFNRKFRPKRT